MIWSYCQAVWVSPSPPPPTHSQQHPRVQLSFYTSLNPPPPLFLPDQWGRHQGPETNLFCMFIWFHVHVHT
jgi:hypothetical protein